MRYILMILLLGFSTMSAAEIDCKRHRIYCKIVKINPRIDKSFAFELSNMIYRAAVLYKIDPMISVAIAAQESGIRNINRMSLGISAMCLVKDGYFCIPTHSITDIGIFQIHVKTAANYNLDSGQLLKDIEYQVESHMKILAQKIRLCADLGDEAWSCYHSRTPKHRKAYVKAIQKYL